MAAPLDGLELRSTITAAGELRLTLDPVAVADPGPGEIVVAVRAAPINPSDLGLLLGPADLSTLRGDGSADAPVAIAAVPERRLAGVEARLDQSMPVGNEGAGTVVRAGAGAEALVGRTVALVGGGMYTRYRTVRAAEALPLPEGTTAEQGASAFVNPMTALAMLETMRAEGHHALVHTAAASNLGQMLVRLAAAEKVPLVNVVRSGEQAALLRAAGAAHVCDSSTPDFADALTEAVAATGATLAFDAVGGGDLAGRILAAMERAANRAGGDYSRYGSSVHKQVYIYGALDVRPTVLDRGFGFAWGVAGWLLTPVLARLGGERVGAMRARVAAELTTTFASRYTATIGLREALDPAVIAAYARRATGEKYLLDPSR